MQIRETLQSRAHGPLGTRQRRGEFADFWDVAAGDNEMVEGVTKSVQIGNADEGARDADIQVGLDQYRDPIMDQQKMLKQEKVLNGVILSGAGSVRGYQIHQVSNRDFPSKNTYVKDPTAPADILPRESIEVRSLVFHHA